MMPITLTLCRHGESEENVIFRAFDAKKRHPAEAAVLAVATWKRRLSSLGVRQAVALGKWYEAWRSSECESRPLQGFVSPYARTCETAGHSGIQARWRRELRLGERNWGALMYISLEEREKRYGDIFSQKRTDPLLSRLPRGEAMQDVISRAHSWCSSLARDYSAFDVVAVSHGEWMHCAQYVLDHWGPEDLHQSMHHHGPDTEIINCRVIQYSRIDEYGQTHPQYVRKRFVNPSAPDDAISNRAWTPLSERTFSCEELLQLAEMYDRQI
jgi:broad specificity phosphatase PhoE